MASGNEQRSMATPSAIPNLKNRIPRLEPRRRRTPQSKPVPIPETPPLPPPPDVSSLSFLIPSKRILSVKDQELFASSSTYNLILAFIFGLSESVVDTPVSSVKDDDLSGPVKAILAILDEAEALVKAMPPDETGGSRFGNQVFRAFVEKAQTASPSWHQKLDISPPEAVQEVEVYLNNCYGDSPRLDYGSGHELNFVMWLLCLYQLRILKTSDFKPLVLKVFARYLELMRLIQSTYYIEPAGSHGVWGLDDFQFLPFLFGASQLLHHPFITPRAIHQELTLEEFGPDYMYLSQVSFVNSTKTVKSLRWHSPMLDDISSAKNWAKIEGGMKIMFVADVLKKKPVMQHFLFGSLIPAADGMSFASEMKEDELDDPTMLVEQDGHTHLHHLNNWGACCGIKVPSSIAAVKESQKHGAGESLRRIPFD
jgi:serine/threonine-protein phosphatase 2A activator